MKVATWAKYTKEKGFSSHWAKEHYGFEFYGNFRKESDDLRSLDEVVRSWVEDKAGAEKRDVSVAVYDWKKRGWEISSYDLEIYIK